MSRLTSDDVVLDLSMASVLNDITHARTSYDSCRDNNNNNGMTIPPDKIEQNPNSMLPTYQAIPTIVLEEITDDGGEGHADKEIQECDDGQQAEASEQRDEKIEMSENEDEAVNEDEDDDVLLDSDNSIKYMASLDKITASGFYTATWRITTPLEKRMETTINIKNNTGGRIEVAGSWKRVENNDVNVTTPKMTRFRLDKKLWVQEGYRVEAELRVGFKRGRKPNTIKSEIASLFELQPFNPENNSTLVMSFKHQMNFPISLVPPCFQGDSNAAVIDAVISKDEKSMVTLSRTAIHQALDIWDLETIAATTTPRLPVASVRFPGVDEDNSGASTFKAEISSNGQYVVMFEYPGEYQWKMDEGFENKRSPVRVFQRTSSIHTNEKQKEQSNGKVRWADVKDSEVETLVELHYDPKSPLSAFLGSVKFAHRTPGNIQPTACQEYVLVACDGIHVDVYDIHSGFKLLSTLSLAPHFEDINSAIDALRFIDNLQDTLSIWHRQWSQESTVWNWRTGQCVGHFSGSYNTALSRDESILFVQFWYYIGFYSVATGAQLGIFDISLDDGETNLETPFDSVGRLSVMQWDRQTRQGAVHEVNVLSAEVIEKITIRLPFSPLPIRCLNITSTTGTLKTVMCRGEQSIEFLAIPTDEESTAVPKHNGCGPECTRKTRKAQEELKVYYDEDQHCTFKCIENTIQKTFHVVRITDGPDSTCQTLLELGEEEYDPKRNWAFYPSQKRLLIWQGWSAELWELPDSLFSTECKLLTLIGGIFEQSLCKHGNLLQASFQSLSVVFDTSLSTFLKPRNMSTLMYRINNFATGWKAFSVKYRSSIIRLIEAHINIEPIFEDGILLGKSVMWTVVLSAVESEDDSFLRAVLGSNHRRYWTPSENEFSADPEKDMIAYLISIFKLPVAWILIEYCLARAHDTDPKFLDILAISMPHLLEKHSDIAGEIARRASFVKVKDQPLTCRLSVINNIQWRLKFWKPANMHLHKIIDKSPVFNRLYQLPSVHLKERSKTFASLSNEIQAVRMNNRIKSHLFVVPFSLVWTVHSKGLRPPSAGQTGLATSSTPMVFKILRTLWHFVYPFDTVFVQTHFTDPEVFDNPAIVALMTYKWTRFARYFWMIRMMVQTGYELLVLAVTFMQIYDVDHRGKLSGGYIAIIVLGYLLLHLEFQQMRAGVGQYFSSPYNYVDLSVYIIPLVASASLLVNAEITDSLRAMSFAIILIYLHFIFELRVYKNVCKVVTIVVNILMQIPAFFVILAIFILAFAHSINHLTEINFRSDLCFPNDDGSIPTCQTLRDEFPTTYLQTVSATYFFMTGDYSPVSTSLTDGHWTSQLMIALFFFLTAVLMMNVVIALMNGAYSDAVILADQTWLKNRLELVASAENLTYYLPNFREYFDFFPKHVYYTATDKEMANFREKYNLMPLQFSFPTISYNGKDGPTATVETITVPAIGKTSSEEVITLSGVKVIVETSLIELQNKMNDEKRFYINEMEAKMIKERQELESKMVKDRQEIEIRASKDRQEMENRAIKDRQDMEAKMVNDRQELEKRFAKEKQEAEQRMSDMVESLKAILLAQQSGIS